VEFSLRFLHGDEVVAVITELVLGGRFSIQAAVSVAAAEKMTA
jgi:hypothetical protein